MNLNNISITRDSHWNTGGDNYEFTLLGKRSVESYFCCLLEHHICVYGFSYQMRFYSPAEG